MREKSSQAEMLSPFDVKALARAGGLNFDGFALEALENSSASNRVTVPSGSGTVAGFNSKRHRPTFLAALALLALLVVATLIAYDYSIFSHASGESSQARIIELDEAVRHYRAALHRSSSAFLAVYLIFATRSANSDRS